MLLDPAVEGGADFIGAVSETARARVLVCSSDCGEESVLAAIQAGAVGYLRKDTLTTRRASPPRSRPRPTAPAS